MGDAHHEFLAGTVAGISATITGHPFDTVKVRLQCRSQREGAWQVFRTIVSQDKVAGLWRGVTSPMLGVALMNASVFGSYGVVLRALGEDRATSSLAPIFLAGAGAGLMSACVTCPIDRIKTIQQTAPGKLSTLRTLKATLHAGGVRSLYRGMSVTMLRDVGYGPYYLSYELCTRVGLRQGETPSTPRIFVAGGVAGVIGWASTFPVDVLKSRVQASDSPALYDLSRHGTSNDPVLREPQRLWPTARQMWQREGPQVFVRGLGPTVVRALPVNMVTFYTFELTLRTLKHDQSP